MKKIPIILMCFFVLFLIFSYNIHRVSAYWGIFDTSVDIPQTTVNTTSATANTGNLATNIATQLKKTVISLLVTAQKIAALLAVQKITRSIIGSAEGGGVISNYNNYLYISPQQRAMAQMNSFFTSASAGRLSGLNYEGIGPNYDAYLVAQARYAISGQVFATDIQQIVSDPRQMFSTGNMKGVMSFFGNPANNPYGYVMTSQSKYNAEFAKAQDIARSEQDRGFLPTKTSSGLIKQPAALLQNLFMQVDQMGTQLIMNAANDEGGTLQIGAGGLISIGARLFSYATADDENKAKIQGKNDQFPFSLGYSTAGGLGINAGGVTANTGAGAVGANGQIGNTKINGNINCTTAGCQTTTTTQRTNTYDYNLGGTSSSGTKPNVNVTAPSITTP